MISKLRRKFIAIVMGVATGILCVVFAVLVISTQSGLVRQSEEMLTDALYRNENGHGGKFDGEKAPWESAGGEADGSSPQEGSSEGEDFQGEPPEGMAPRDGWMKDRFSGRSLVFTVTVAADGTVTWEDRARFLLEDSSADLTQAVQTAAADSALEGTLSDAQLRWKKRATEDGGWIIALADTSQERNSLMELLKNALIVGAVTLLVFFGASVLLARWAVKPVETAWNQQKQFVGDASHELKTPLTVILSNADMILSHPGEDGSRWAENIQAEGQRMKELIQQMLSLARSDDGTSQPVFETVDLSYLCTDSVLAFEPLAFEGGHELIESIQEGVRLQGDKAGLTQLCGILLDNAQKYASPNGKIWMTLESNGKTARLSVANEGEAIPQEDLGRIFERFYRSDPSRHGEGHGLGLAIARRVTEQHKGKIWAESEPGKNTFLVTLPVK